MRIFRVLTVPPAASLAYSSCPRELVRLFLSLTHTRGPTGLIVRVGERLSPYVALACIAMAVRMILS